MAATYDLSNDFASGDELTTQVPFWVVGIARFANPVTWDPRTRRAISEDDDVALAETEPLVLTNEVAQVSTNASKEAHITNLQATLFPHENFLSQVLPGDWVVCCMLNSEQQGLRVAEKMRAGEAINGWNDGLKFLGKVHSCRKGVQVTRQGAESGAVRTSFTVNAAGFTEFDSMLFYHPQLVKNLATPASLQEFGVLIQNITAAPTARLEGQRSTSTRSCPSWSRSSSARVPGTARQLHRQSLRQGAINASPNTRYLVPATVFKWLGLQRAKTYNDLLYVLMLACSTTAA
jgi:hypothetical protein